MESLSCKKRVRDDSAEESEFDLPEVKKLREDLLGIFDESSDVCTASQDLDSFIKTFEDEISAKSSPAIIDLTSESGDSQPELGYLYGASDDELGLPPSATSPEKTGETDLLRVVPETVELSSEFWGLGEQLTSYDSFEYGYEFAGVENTGDGEFLAFEDGLFDYTDLGFGSTDTSWRSETLPAN